MAKIIIETQVKAFTNWVADQGIADAIVEDIPNQTVVPGLVDIPATGVVRVVCDGHTHNNDDYVHVFHMAYSSAGAGSTAKTAELLADIAAWVIASFGTWAAQAVVDWGMDTIRLYVLDAISGTFVPVGTQAASVQGTNVTYDPLPSQTACKVNVSTGVSTIRGGMSFGAFNENHNGPDGEIRTTVLSDLADLFLLLYSPDVLANYTIYPGVWSRSLATIGLARSLTVNNIWDGLYRRKQGVGA